MTKRIIALLLALILTVGLLPTVALATEGDPTPDSGSTGSFTDTVQSDKDTSNNRSNPVHVTKSVETDADGYGWLTMEAYVTNPLQVVTDTVPLDIVLVLDQSGSMGYCINCSSEYKDEEFTTVSGGCTTTTEYQKVGMSNNVKPEANTTYYFVYSPWIGNPYYREAYYCNGNHLLWSHQPGWYYGDHKSLDNSMLYKEVTYGGHKHRLDALTAALKTFVDNVEENGGDHNVAVVGYANRRNNNDTNNTELLTGNFSLSSGRKANYTSRYYPKADPQASDNQTIDSINGKQASSLTTSDYQNALLSLKKNADGTSAAGKQKVLDAIDALTAAGGTYTLEGLNMAESILTEAKKNNSGRKQVIILFTDGDTDSDQQEVYKLANKLKNSGVLIYTVGLFAGADQTKGNEGKKDDNNLFLNKVSNNNKLYTSSKPATATDKTYYLPATNANSLNTVFEQISKEVSMLDLTIDSSAVLQDTLSGYFTFDVDSGNVADKIEVWTAEAKDVADDGQVTWKSAVKSDTLKAEVSEKTVSVKGFNYGEKAVTVSHPNGVKTVTGEKLIIKIPIKPDASNENVTWTAGKNNYDTNDTSKGKEAGLTGYKDKKDHELSTLLPSSPKAPVTGYTVTYQYAGTAPQGAPALPMQATYIKGQTYNVAATSAPSGYQFTGWCKDDANCTSDPTSGPQTMGTANVTYYGKFEKNEVEVDLASYVKKTLTATSLPEGFSETFNATIKNKTTNEEKALKVTFGKDEAGQTKNFTAADGVTTTVSLTAGTIYSYTVTETTGTNKSITYGTIPQDFALKVNDDLSVTFGKLNEGTFEADSVGCVTIENKYTPGETSFSLAQKFQKVLESNTADVPRKSFELTITGTTDNTGRTKISGTANIGTLTKQNDKYTGSAYFAFANSLNFSTAGIYKYKVQETGGSTAGMTYDTTEYELVIEVENNNGALEIKSATIGSTDMKNAGPLTITNTFKAAELPLDPPTDPEGNPTAAGAKIVKSLTGDQKTETFTAKIYDGQTEKATATAAATTGTPAAFNGFGTLVFTEAKTYNYTIKEIPGSTAGMKYDESFPNGHTMDITVAENAEKKLFVSEVKIDNVAVDLASNAAWLTITNTYTEPTYAVKKSVVEDPSITVPTGVDMVGYQYPTGGKFIVEKTYTDDTITFLYVIEVSGKNGAEMTIQEQDGGKFINVDYSAETRADITLNAALDTYTVKITSDVDVNDPIKLYAEKTFRKDTDGKFPTTATNALLVNGEDGPKQNTTIEERGALTVDFGALVHKHLTVTGDKSFNGTNFTVNFTEGRYAPLVVSNSIEVYADAGVGEEKLPDLTASVTYTADERNRGLKDFDGADLTINTEGKYFYIVSEQIPAGATGYDTKKYVVGIVVVPDGDGLKVDYVWYHELVEDPETHPEILPDGPTFYNTIDTGRDDYIPIIIPTIINKDTGMLNKTDHFAYVIGYPDGTVHPNGQITRAEVATIFFRLLRDEVRDGAFTTSNSYSDVAYGKWYNNPISTMSALGIITGYPDGTFKPNKPITRAEFAAIAARFDETQSGKSATFSDVIGHWAAKEIGIAYYNDWIKGYPDGTFKPDQNITRAEAMTLINRVLERKPESPADLLTNMNKWTDNMDTSKWYYLDVQEATNSHGYTRKTFNYELWRQMLPDPDWSRYER